jgi:superfamily II DNA or RNA helicase
MLIESNKIVDVNINNIATGFTSNWVRTDVDIMQPKTIGFVHPPRVWQSECFSLLSPSNPISIINAPTGSGKSTMLSMLAYYRTISDKNIKTIIAVPQLVISKGFQTKTFKLPSGEIVDWSVGVDLCSDANNTVEKFKSFIMDDIFYSKEYPFARILVCTHDTLKAAFKKLTPDEKEKHWNNLLICIDETHHIQMHEIADDTYDMNTLGQVIDYSYKNNNELILVSATLFRGDQKGLLSKDIYDNSTKYNLPYDKYMQEMKYLKSFSYDFAIDTDVYTKDILKSINNLFEDDLKKLFIYLPFTNSYMSTGNKTREDKKLEIQEILSQLQVALGGEKCELNKKTGIYHITNSDGLDYKVCDLYDETLDSKTKKFVNNDLINKDPDALDCVITMNKAKEGFDWEHANGMIVVGQRNSLTDVIQMVGRLLRDKNGKEKVKVLHMLPFSPNQPLAPNLDNSLNDYFKAIAISLLMEDVFAPIQIQTNDKKQSTGQPSGSSQDTNIFDDLDLDENQRTNLFKSVQESLINFAGVLTDTLGTYSPKELKEEMPSIIEKWLNENDIEADAEQIDKLVNKVYYQFANRTLQLRGINVSNIDWQMIESADPIEFALRYIGKDVNSESLKELRALIVAGETESNRKTHELCQWIIENGRNPKESENVIEDKLYSFLSNRRQAKKGAKKTAWYNSDQKIAESYNIKDLFETRDLEELSNIRTHELCKWVIDNNYKLPRSKSSDAIEKYYGQLLSDMRKVYKIDHKKGTSILYASNLEIVKSYNLENILFETLESKAILKTHELCKWILQNDKKPSNNSKDPLEKKLALFMHNTKSAKHGKRLKGNAWYASLQEIIDSYNLSFIFEYDDKENLSNKQTHRLCQWIVSNKRLPTRISKNAEEKEIYNILTIRKKAKRGDGYAWYDSNQKIVESYGLDKIFDTLDPETESNNLTNELCKWIIKNNRNPQQRASEENERKLARFLLNKKQSKKKLRAWYQSDQDIAESYGFSNLFDIIKINKTIEL